jgi:heme-degrading monooxygenase HmoA
MITEHALLEVVAGREAEFVEAMQTANLEDHTDGFRGSPGYEAWRAALHHFYDPFPVVEHFAPVPSA